MATMVSTTLTAGVTATTSQIPLAAITGVVAPGAPNYVTTLLYCEREAMEVRSYAGLVVRVLRGVLGTAASKHPSGAVVWVGPSTAYAMQDPSGTYALPGGGYVPLVVIPTGNVWNDSSGTWGIVSGSAAVDSVFGRVGAVVATAGDYEAADITGLGTAAVLDTGVANGDVAVWGASNIDGLGTAALATVGVANGNVASWGASNINGLGTAALLTAGTAATNVPQIGSVTMEISAALMTSRASAPADGDVGTAKMAVWFDPTDGNPKLMVKAKQSNATVVTGAFPLGTVALGGNFSAYAAGTAYTLTDTAALLNFGTTDPTITITQPGTYVLFARALVNLVAATFAANQTLVIKIRRTNNTAADVTGATTTITMPIVTTLSYSLPTAVVPVVVYTTANADDILQVFGSISAAPGAGDVNAVAAEIVALRIA